MSDAGRKTSWYVPAELDVHLRARLAPGSSRSGLVTRDLLRLYELYSLELEDIRRTEPFTAREASLILEALRGTLVNSASSATLVWARVADGIRLDHLDERWDVDGDALVRRLQGYFRIRLPKSEHEVHHP